MKMLLKVLLTTCIIILFIIIFAILFIKLYKPFGASPNKEDKKDYENRSEIFKDGKFQNTGIFSVMSTWNDPYKNRCDNKGKLPTDEVPVKKFNYTENKNNEDILITWFGHSSILIQMHNMNILVDPIFDKASSPVSFIGPKRYSKVPLNIEDLPNIDVVLLTHDHYDHVSYKTLMSLENKVKKFLVPLGIDKDLGKFGIKKSKIENMAWWEEKDINGLTIACTPSRHFSGRYILDSNDTLWCSWILKDENNTVFDSGDGGYGDHFKEIKEKYKDITLAILDGSQYSESWHDVHMFPEEAGQASIDLEARITFLDHYGAYCLSNHSWDDPVNRFTMFAKEKNIEYMTPLIGETVNLKDYKNYQKEWWKDIK